MAGVAGRGIEGAAPQLSDRLAAVQRAGLLLASSSVPLDRLAAITARAVTAPVAVISLVDVEREYVIAAHGPVRATPLPRQVVDTGGPLAVDALPGSAPAPGALVAAAAYPIRLGRYPVGVLLVADERPRRWSAAELGVVRDAADLVSALLAGDRAAHDAAVAARDTADAAALAVADAASAAAENDAVLARMREAFVAIDAAGVIRRWSVGAAALFGWTKAEALGQDVDRLTVAERSRAAFRTARDLAARLAHPVPQHLLMWVRYRDGHEFPVDASVSAAGAPGGAPRLYVFLYDATDRVSAERAAERQRAFRDALLDSLDAAVAACDAEGRLVFTNRTLRSLYGLAAGIGEGPDSPPVPLDRTLAGELVRDQPVQVRRPGAGTRHLLVNGRQIRTAEDELLGAVVAAHDVTDLMRANRFKECEVAVSRVLDGDRPVGDAAREVLTAVTTALEWAYAELWLLDEANGVLRLTATGAAPGSGRDLADLAPAQLSPGQGLAGAVWQGGDQLWIPDLRDAGAGPAAQSLADAGLCTAVAVPIRSADRVLGVLGFFAETVEDPQDALEALLGGIAAHVGQFLERRRAALLTAELARTKDEYIGLVGHELRTPLTSIAAYTDLVIEDPALDPEHRELLEVVQRNTAVLRGIIADLLDLAALDSGHAQIRPHPVDAADLVREALAAIGPDVEAKALAVVADLGPPLVVPADPRRLRQVVDTLLSNAVKYTPADGTITVRLHRDGDSAVLSVADTGVGIPPAERVKLFHRFFRGAAAKAARVPGSGLGLAIARAIVDRHGGTIAMVDTEGPGSTFELRLPVGPGPG